MKKQKILSVVLCLTLLLSVFLSLSASAFDNSFVNLKSAKIEYTCDSDNTFTATISKTTLVGEKENESTFLTEKHVINDLSNEKLTQLTERHRIANATSTISDDMWFLGSSCYIKVTVTYSSKYVNGLRYYRMDKVQCSSTVNSGTRITAAKLNLGAVGYAENGALINNHPSTDVINSLPYSTTLPSTYPYIREVGGGILGATFIVTAARPSGSSSTKSVSANVFQNS